MGETITVFHQNIPGNQNHTVFTGPELEYRMQEDGALVITKWIADNQTGNAVFAAGQWIYVCQSKPIEATHD